MSAAYGYEFIVRHRGKDYRLAHESDTPIGDQQARPILEFLVSLLKLEEEEDWLSDAEFSYVLKHVQAALLALKDHTQLLRVEINVPELA